MSYIHLSIQDALRAHKQTLAVLDQQAEEARRPAGYVAEVPFEIPEEVFDDECECGGTFDEDDACSDCAIGHDDHDLNSCFACYERAVGQAEAAFEGER